MNEHLTTTETLQIPEFTSQLPGLVNRVSRRQSRIIVEKDGRPVAAFISIEELARLEQIEEERTARFRILDDIGAAFANVPVDELETEVACALEEARAKRRAETKQVVGAKM